MAKAFGIAISAMAALLPATASAQDSDDMRVRVGLGAQLQPKFVGADDHEVAPLVNFDWKRGNEQFDFEAPDDNFDISIIKNDGFSFGPVANYQSGRKNKDVDAPVGKVKGTIEAGAFVQYDLSESTRLRAEVRQGLNGHEGLVASLGADQIWRNGDKYVFSIGPRVLFSNARYQRAWFGVDSAAALATGLPTYRPDAGIHAVGATSGLHTMLSDRFGLFGFARYERLIGDAAKSPLIREYGSRNQTSAGIGLSYVFTVPR